MSLKLIFLTLIFKYISSLKVQFNVKLELSPRFMFCRKLRKISTIQQKKSRNQHCAEKGPMSRHYVEKVLTLLQCRDIAVTSAEEGKVNNMAMLLHHHDIVTTLTQCRDIKSSLNSQLHQTSNVATPPRHGYDIGCSEKNLNVQCRDITTQCFDNNKDYQVTLLVDQCHDITMTSWRHQNKALTSEDIS